MVGFTATQIPHIEHRRYPAALAGARYPEGLPIWPEDELEAVVRDQKVDRCLLAYSDLHHNKAMELASRCLAAGAEVGKGEAGRGAHRCSPIGQPKPVSNPPICAGFCACTLHAGLRTDVFVLPQFLLVPPRHTMLRSSKPVVAVTAVRTGCGKSQTSHYLIAELKRAGRRCVLVRHPMPYGDLAAQAVQRFETYADLARHKVTIEEREEYEQHLKSGTVVSRTVAACKTASSAARWPSRRRARHPAGLCGRRLRGDPAPRRGGGGRDLLRRRKQRHAVLQARPLGVRGRPPPLWARNTLSPRRRQLSLRRCHHRQQGLVQDDRRALGAERV